MRGAIAEAHKVIRDISLPRLWLEAELVRLASEKALPAATTGTVNGSRSPAVETPKPKPEAPRASATPPAAKPESKPEPQSQPVEPAPAAVVAVSEATSDPELDGAREVWTSFLNALPENTAMAKKLNGSRLQAFAAGKGTVEVLRQMDADWMTDDPKRAAHVVKSIRELSDQDWHITYIAGKARTKATEEPAAVELAIEGQKLVEKTREILGS